MAESAADNASEVVRATPPPSADDTENNGVDTDTVSFLMIFLCTNMVYLCVNAGGL